MLENVLAGSNVPARVAIEDQTLPSLPYAEQPHNQRHKEHVRKRGNQQFS